MDAEWVYSLLEQRENDTLECKEAKSNVPKRDFRRTYSALANTNGGTILLGVKEDMKAKTYEITGVLDSDEIKKSVWDFVNDSTTISVNLLHNELIKSIDINDKEVVAIQVPRASRVQRPVYINNNPYTGTYRRGHEGNYACSHDEVQRMIIEANTNYAFDRTIVNRFTLDDIHKETFQKYRQRFQNRSPDDSRNELDDILFLKRIGGYLRDRDKEVEGLTVAGLLVFGKPESILEKFPYFFLDYRETEEAGTERWVHRITSQHNEDAGNLFSFYTKVIKRLLGQLSVPFQIEQDGMRAGDTRIHRALREALLNTLIHADYQATRGVVIEVNPKNFYFENAGGLRLPKDSAIEGGTSDPRNPTIFQVFSLIGLGERSGYGLSEIFGTWKEQHFQEPIFKDEVSPERTVLDLSIVSLLPPESLTFIKSALDREYLTLSMAEVSALVMAHAEGEVTNTKLRKIVQIESSEATTLLRSLVESNLLEGHGNNRNRTYTLGPHFMKDFKRQRTSGGTSWNMIEDTSGLKNTSGIDVEATLGFETPERLKVLQDKIKENTIQPDEISEFILLTCDRKKKTAYEIGEELSREPRYLTRKYLGPLVEANHLKVSTRERGLYLYETV